MKKESGFLLLGLMLFAGTPTRADEDPKTFAGKEEMSGYRLSDYAGFEKNWKLVTVRYRKDTGEQRFVYANDIAWKALNSKATDYPDGAVFAKIAFATQDDPAFTSSATPTSTRRYQLMVRNKSKHKETDGWGYALFDGQARTFPENPKQAVIACHACHRIVPDRGFVFSVPLDLTPVTYLAPAPSAGVRLKFEALPLSSIPAPLRVLLPSGVHEVSVLQSEMSKSLFQGTLDEIRPALAIEAIRGKQPALMMSEDGARFSLVFEDSSTRLCRKQNSAQTDMIGITSQLPGQKPAHRKLSFCATGPVSAE